MIGRTCTFLPSLLSLVDDADRNQSGKINKFVLDHVNPV